MIFRLVLTGTVLAALFFPKLSGAIVCELPENGVPENELQERLWACNREIALQNERIKEKQREATTIERDLGILNYKIERAKLEIRSRTISIQKLKKAIAGEETALEELKQKMKKMRGSTAELLRRTSELDNRSLAETFLAGVSLSEAFIDRDTFASVRRKLEESFEDLKTAREAAAIHKEKLEEEREEEERFQNLREIEKRRVEQQEEEKNRILKITRGEEVVYRDLLLEKQKTAAQIKNRMLEFLGGGELRFEEALRVVRTAEEATGVRAAFILAVLTQESAIDGVIGRNLGRCFYNTPWQNSSGTVMGVSQRKSFILITEELGLDPEKTPVSCPIGGQGQYGGAMGPAQFMPRTWWDAENGTGYKRRISKITGNNPPSPFNNLDAFTGTALFLNDALRGCRAAGGTVSEQESCAAAKYYAGNNWRQFRKSYGARVASRAVAFQKDIDFLES